MTPITSLCVGLLVIVGIVLLGFLRQPNLPGYSSILSQLVVGILQLIVPTPGERGTAITGVERLTAVAISSQAAPSGASGISVFGLLSAIIASVTYCLTSAMQALLAARMV